MYSLFFVARIWHEEWQVKIYSNHLKGKKHGNNTIIYFLPVERFRLFLAVLEMCRLV
jgi:hypothetical protein